MTIPACVLGRHSSFPGPRLLLPLPTPHPTLSPTGAVELWELDENETLIVSKFCKYEHDDIVSTVTVLSSGTQAVSGSKDFW